MPRLLKTAKVPALHAGLPRHEVILDLVKKGDKALKIGPSSSAVAAVATLQSMQVCLSLKITFF